MKAALRFQVATLALAAMVACAPIGAHPDPSPKPIVAPIAQGTEDQGTEWARIHPDVVQEYRSQYTRPDGVVNWDWYSDVFRACADRGMSKHADVKIVVTMCSLEANGAQANAQQEERRQKVHAAWDARRSQEKEATQETGP